MIAYLKGSVTTKNLNNLIIEVNGIGYLVNIPVSDIESITKDQSLKLFIYEVIKEDLYDLYGFLNETTKTLFELLLSVKNIGPKAAISILNIDSANNIRNYISTGDVQKLTSAKGVGRRAAEQIIVELRDKVGLSDGNAIEDILHRSNFEDDDASLALVALGYSKDDATRLLSKIDKSLPTDQKIKLALKDKS